MVKKLLLVLWLLVLLTPVNIFAQEDDNCSAQLPSRLQVNGQGRVLPGEANNLRAQATTNSELVGEIPADGIFDVLEGPICADGIVWWRVEYENLMGWTGEGMDTNYWVEAILQPELSQTPDAEPKDFCEGALEPRLTQGQWGKVTPGDANNLRVDPNPEAELITTIPSQHFFQVVAEPVCTVSGVWWQVEYEGIVGWTLEAGSQYFLEPAFGSNHTNPVEEALTTCPNLPPSRLAPNTIARIIPNDNNTIRNAPSTFADPVGTALSAAPVRVLRGPRCEANITWWQVEVMNDEIVGWTAETILDDYLIEPSTLLMRDNLDQVIELNSFGRGAIIDAVWWTPDSRQLIVPTAAGLWYYNVPNLNADPTFIPYDFPIHKMAISADNQQLALGERDGTVRIYSLADQTMVRLPSTSEGRLTTLESLTYHESEHILEVKTLEREHGDPIEYITYYDTDQLILTEPEERLFPSNDRLATKREFAYSPSEDQVAEAQDGLGLNIRQVPPNRNQSLRDFPIINSRYGNLSKITGVAYSPDGLWLVTVARDGRLRLWDVVNAYEPFASIEDHFPPITAVSVHPRQDVIATGSEDGVVRLWNRITGDLMDDYRSENIEAQINDLDFNPDGSELAVAYNDSLRIWDFRLGAEKSVLGEAATQAQYSEDGNYLFSAYLNPEAVHSTQQQLRQQHHFTVWQLPSYTNITENLRLPSDFDAGRFSLSLEGNNLVLESNPYSYTYPYEYPITDSELLIGIELGSWRQLTVTYGYELHDYFILDNPERRVVKDFVFSEVSTAHYLRFTGFDYISADYDDWSSSMVMDVYEDQAVLELGRHSDYITDVDFDINGFYLVSAGVDGVVKVWGIPSAE